MQQRTPRLALIVMAAVGVAIMIVATFMLLSACKREPPPTAVQPWCVDSTAMILLDDAVCTVDLNHDGFMDGELYVPVRGLVKPARGAKLPAQVKLDGSTHRRVYVTVKPVVPRVKPVTPKKPAPAATGSRRKFG